MDSHPSLPVLVLAAFAALIYFGHSGRTPDKGTQVALVPSASTWEGIRTNDDKPEATLAITAPNGDHFSLSLYADGVPYQERAQSDANAKLDVPWKYEYTIHHYPLDFGVDIGAWAGFRLDHAPEDKRSDAFDIGLRISPARFAYGVISPDLLVSPSQAGVGCSFYAPTQTVAPIWQHVGIGLAYVADYHGGSGWCPYLSLSTRF
jgi:hypothetical protein